VSVVYALIDPRTDLPRYVGVTFQTPARRLSQHLTAGKAKRPYPVAMWISKLLGLGLQPQLRVVRESDDPEFDPWALEVETITAYRAAGHDLLNVAPGGIGGGIGPKSAQHAANISAGLKGRPAPPRTPEWRAAHSAKLTGRKRSAETCRRISEAHQQRRVLVDKTCPCGNSFKVIPSRVDRSHYCATDCHAKTRRKVRRG
jgi:hypothetical protein